MTQTREDVMRDAMIALEQLEDVEEAYSKWHLFRALKSDKEAQALQGLSDALFAMLNSDPDDGPGELERALRALIAQEPDQ